MRDRPRDDALALDADVVGGDGDRRAEPGRGAVEAGSRGLGFTRFFTTPGVHPYDEVEWEERDAVIRNWRDGSISFEQRGVEFPADWSMNATTIVAQKYFRGQLGSPERERSVRQMIDRVADTITGWGVEGGYFADEESARVFNQELKHLLVHQKAAFNSPVWFNVGVEDEPQCSACQPWHALVSTPSGYLPIGEIVERDLVGLEVHDAEGTTRVVATKHNGTKRVYRVQLRNGSFVEATGDHLVRAVDERRAQSRWSRVDELEEGMRLHLHPHRPAPGRGAHDERAVAEAALAGWLQADGFVGQYETGTNQSLTVEFQVANHEEEAWVKRHLDVVFPDVHRKVSEVDGLPGYRRIRLYGEVLRDFVERHGLLDRRHGIRVPASLWTAPAEVVSAYLRSVFQADGYVTGDGSRVGFAVISERWTEDVQLLLLRLGIYSRRRRKHEPRPDRAEMWEVDVAIRSERERFGDLVGFVDQRKTERLEASCSLPGRRCPDLREEQIVGIEDLGETDVYDIQTESGHYLSNSIVVHNCFILSVEDTMNSILNWYVEEGLIFKGGSGAGINLSTIRSSKEQLKGGGEASGPVSFMRGADASAGTIKSGGKTRRAAKMVILDVDHPDIEEFIWTKAREEKKIRVLREAGFDMDLDSPDYASIQYQNANNSVRVTDAFMRAYDNDEDYDLPAVTTGEVLERKSARDVMRQIAEAAWECADPGMQYDDNINDWHTCPNSGRINASNPCFPGDAQVHTDKGLIRFDELVDRVRAGERFGVYTHDTTNPDEPAERMEITSPEAFMLTGTNEILRLEFSNGARLRCTPGHRIWTDNRGWVEARELTTDDRVRTLDLPTPAVHADRGLPVSSEVADYRRPGDHRASIRLPDKWSKDLGHYLGWLIGDGAVSGNVVTTVYGTEEEQETVLPGHRDLIAWMNGDRAPTPSAQANGTMQLRQSRRVIRRFLEALGVSDANAADKRVPWSVREAHPAILGAFLRGLFDADGCVVDQDNGTRYVGLGSRSRGLLGDVQTLLTTFGIHARIYEVNHRSPSELGHVRADGTEVTYEGGRTGYDLRITARSLERFAAHVGFSVPSKQETLTRILEEHTRYETDTTVRLVERTSEGFEQTYNLSEPRNHSYVVDGVVVRNCSEYMHLDNSACNLASLNLRKYYDYDEDRFDVEAFKRAVEVIFTAQEIIVDPSSYPTEEIGSNARRFRELGLGYANLGGLLMSIGLPYDSDEGRAWAGAITGLLCGHAYHCSTKFAQVVGPFDGYAENAEPMQRVIRKHREAVEQIDPRPVQEDLLTAARDAWDAALTEGAEHGFRNSQATVLAPTGCLVGGSLVTTDRGLVRLSSLGDPAGPQWQDIDVTVGTDEGPRRASQFYVNGLESVVTVDTARGHRIQGTPRHRIRVVADDGTWHWRHFADLEPDDRVPLALDSLIGEPREVSLPPLGEAHWTGEHHATAPGTVTPELAELVGYFMGDGSLHARGIRLCVAAEDRDVVERLRILGKELFDLDAQTADRQGYVEVAMHSVRLTEWWEAVGFAKERPQPDHTGKGFTPHIPDAILHSNDREVYAAFLRGLFEADGTVTAGYPHWSTTLLEFSREIQALLLALGYPTTRKSDVTGWGGSELAVLRLLNKDHAGAWLEEVGFVSRRKAAAVATDGSQQSARGDHIPVPRELVEELAPVGTRLRSNLLQGIRRGRVSRTLVAELHERTGDERLGHLLGFFYDEVASAELGADELTYDLSVPDNVTYLANGFVSHNTIGLMMDCDTTGIEPDLGLVKTKKLVGGGSMAIVNQTVPQALRSLGYTEEQIEAIIAHIDTEKTIEGAPALQPEHERVFQCAMGDNAIPYMGHVRMMAAAQPFISGAISKCVVGDTLLTTEDGLVRIGSLHRGEEPDSFRDHRMTVASTVGEEKTDAFYYGGVRPVREVVLRSGQRITGTPNHRLLVAEKDGGLGWRRLDQLRPGDQVTQRLGADMWSPIPARLEAFGVDSASNRLGTVRVPEEMTEELAFLLGAYAARGGTRPADRTVRIPGSEEVVVRIADAVRSQFGVDPRLVQPDDDRRSVEIEAGAVVDLLGRLGHGDPSERRIPAAVLRSSRPMVLAFLEGLWSAADVTRTAMTPEWSIRLPSPGLLDDLQAVLANLGIVHGRISRRGETGCGEVYASGRAALRLLRLVPFTEAVKRQCAEELLQAPASHRPTDMVPGITPAELSALLPPEHREAFVLLRDPRTRYVSRRTLERVAAVPGVDLPAWLQQVLEGDLHFSPVESVREAGKREVFDLSVPTTHAFVGNGIVNHNTVNMPEDVSVEDVEQLYYDAWQMGLKAVAIYRDNCKVAQPLSVDKKEEPETEEQDEPGTAMVRRKLPKQRPSQTISFRVADAKGYITAGEYPGDGIGEIFVKLGKQGSTLSGLLDAFAISVSIGLQYGVPLETFVQKFMNMRFEPAGVTDDEEVRFASSIIDYLARKLALEYLPYDKRADLGIYTLEERRAAADDYDEQPAVPKAPSPEAIAEAQEMAVSPTSVPTDVDAPMCMTCGIKMTRSGSCHVCEQCGATSGCS